MQKNILAPLAGLSIWVCLIAADIAVDYPTAPAPDVPLLPGDVPTLADTANVTVLSETTRAAINRTVLNESQTLNITSTQDGSELQDNSTSPDNSNDGTGDGGGSNQGYGYQGYNFGNGNEGYTGYGFGGFVPPPVCNQTLQNKNLFPTTLVAFQAYKGDSYSIGEVLFILAKFPDSSCNVPDPGYQKGCVPRLEVNVAPSKTASAMILVGSASAAQVQSDYSVDFSNQPELYTADGIYTNPWVFILQVTAGMRTASLDVNSLIIPANCSSVNATFNTTKVEFPSPTLLPAGILIDTRPPSIVAVYSTEPAGRYTAGHFIDIIIKFSKDVELSELPGKYSNALLNAQANGTLLFGVPYIELNSKALVMLRGYANAKDRSKLSFLYQVGTGEETPAGLQLDLADNTTIQLNGGTITGDQNGLDADLETVPPYGTVGSMSDRTRAKIYIEKTGEKFPPHKYDSDSTPDTAVTNARRRNGQMEYYRRQLRPTLVSVELQLNAVFNINEKAQQLQADFMLISNWTDPRLLNPQGPAVTMYPPAVLESGKIWSPRLTFHNRRDLTNYIEGVVRVYNTGQVVFIQRFIASYAVNLNVRDFPFDTQTFQWNVRSTTYPKSVVKIVPSPPSAWQNVSALLVNVVDPTFSYSDYNQTSYTITTGVFANYDLLAISVKAKRIATMSTIFLVFPLCVVSGVICLVLHQEPANNSRLSVPMAVITATMAFSFVISNMCPPVSYLTRIHLLLLQSYFFSVTVLFFNYYLWCIEFGRKELSRLNNDNKTLLNDAHWMPRKIKPPPTNVVVLPDGIHKPPPEEKPAPSAPPPPKDPPADEIQAAAAATAPANDAPSAPKSAAPAESKPEKSAETGAYPNKDGKFQDVKDLLESDEVKTFKKLRWGGGPIKMLWGMAVIHNGNSAAWASHIERFDWWLKNIYPVGVVVVIGCILGVRDFAGLGSGPVPYLGVQDLQ